MLKSSLIRPQLLFSPTLFTQIEMHTCLYLPQGKVTPMLFLLILSTKKLASPADNVTNRQIISYIVKNKERSRDGPLQRLEEKQADM